MRINIRTIAPFLILLFLLFGAIASFVVTVLSANMPLTQNSFGGLTERQVIRNLRWLQWWITVMWQ